MKTRKRLKERLRKKSLLEKTLEIVSNLDDLAFLKGYPGLPQYKWDVDSFMHQDGATSYRYYWRKVK